MTNDPCYICWLTKSIDALRDEAGGELDPYRLMHAVSFLLTQFQIEAEETAKSTPAKAGAVRKATHNAVVAGYRLALDINAKVGAGEAVH